MGKKHSKYAIAEHAKPEHEIACIEANFGQGTGIASCDNRSEANERDDDAASSKRVGKERDHGEAEEDGDQVNDGENVSGEEQTEALNTLYEGEFDGTELFVVEEPSEIPEKEDRPPPEDDESAESNDWNTYILNKEIIDEHDWNYRVVTAQHLGIDLKDLATLYPDPFPGYEPPSRETSAPPATPTRPDTSTAPSAPCTPSPAPTKSSGRPDSDESISLEVTDAEDEDEDRVPGTRAIDYADDSDENMGDDEMDEEDMVDDIGADVGHQSQTSTTTAGHRKNRNDDYSHGLTPLIFSAVLKTALRARVLRWTSSAPGRTGLDTTFSSGTIWSWVTGSSGG